MYIVFRFSKGNISFIITCSKDTQITRVQLAEFFKMYRYFKKVLCLRKHFIIIDVESVSASKSNLRLLR